MISENVKGMTMSHANEYEILQSNKVGLDANESYIIVRNGISFLRILGGEPNWDLMTATASEDHGRIHACSDRHRLVESALRLCAEHGASPRVERDWLGREYVKIGVITLQPGETEENFQKESDALFRRFFQIFDSYKDINSRSEGDMRELYDALTVDNESSDVYLSDGVWLSSDGSLHDRAR